MKKKISLGYRVDGDNIQRYSKSGAILTVNRRPGRALRPHWVNARTHVVAWANGWSRVRIRIV